MTQDETKSLIEFLRSSRVAKFTGFGIGIEFSPEAFLEGRTPEFASEPTEEESGFEADKMAYASSE